MKIFTLIAERGPCIGRVFQITPEGTSLGRSSSNQIYIPDPMLSRQHSLLFIRDDVLYVKDLDSANGTLVDNQTVTEAPVEDGQRISVGDSVLLVKATVLNLPESVAAAPAVSVTPPAPPVSAAPVVDISFDGSDASVQEPPPPAPVVSSVPAPPSGTVDLFASEPGIEKSGAEKPAEAPSGSIDLGFENEEEAKKASAHASLRPILWGIAALAVLATGVVYILDKDGKKPQVDAKPVQPEDKTLELVYEKIEAASDHLYRYEMTISADGILRVKLDEQGGTRPPRAVREETRLTPERIDYLRREIEKSNFFTFRPLYEEVGVNPDRLTKTDLTIVNGLTAHRSRTENALPPEAYQSLCEKLETFSQNELKIWAISYSSDRLQEEAEKAYALGLQYYDQRHQSRGNLCNAWQSYRQAVFYMETLSPKPDFYESARREAERCEKELEDRLTELRFRATQSMNLGKWQEARQILLEITEVIPLRDDPRYQEAARQLLDIENNRLKNTRL